MVAFSSFEQSFRIISIEFSLITLSLTLLLPFLFHGYQAKFWQSPHSLKRADIFLLCVTYPILVIILINMAQIPTLHWKSFHLPLLHLIGPVLTILAIRKTPFDRWLHSHLSGSSRKQRPEIKDTSPAETKTPFIPLMFSNQSHRIGWDEIILNQSLKEQLLSIIELLQSPQQALKYGIDVPKGMIFHGPPGTGKTTIARAFASTAGLNFFSVKADDIISKWVGESEKNLSQLFQSAEQHKPAVIFIDEIDTIGRMRGDKSQAWAENLLTHFLQLLDGIEKMEGVYVIGATNRIDLVDDALKRAGRLSKSIEITPPDLAARTQLFAVFLKKLQLNMEIDLVYLAQMTEGCTGADIKEICNQAGLNAFNRESQRGNHRQYLVTEQDLFHSIEQHLQLSEISRYST